MWARAAAGPLCYSANEHTQVDQTQRSGFTSFQLLSLIPSSFVMKVQTFHFLFSASFSLRIYFLLLHSGCQVPPRHCRVFMRRARQS